MPQFWSQMTGICRLFDFISAVHRSVRYAKTSNEWFEFINNLHYNGNENPFKSLSIFHSFMRKGVSVVRELSMQTVLHRNCTYRTHQGKLKEKSNNKKTIVYSESFPLSFSVVHGVFLIPSSFWLLFFFHLFHIHFSEQFASSRTPFSSSLSLLPFIFRSFARFSFLCLSFLTAIVLLPLFFQSIRLAHISISARVLKCSIYTVFVILCFASVLPASSAHWQLYGASLTESNRNIKLATKTDVLTACGAKISRSLERTQYCQLSVDSNDIDFLHRIR